MLWLFTSPLYLAAVLSLALAVMAWRSRTRPGAAIFTLLMAALCIWALSEAFQLSSRVLATKLFWTRITCFGVVLIPSICLLLALEFTRQKERLNPTVFRVLAVEPAVILLLSWTNDFHHLIWQDIALDLHGPVPLLTYTHPPLFWIHIAYSYLLLLISAGLVIRAFRKFSSYYHRQIIALITGMCLPLAISLFFLLKPEVLGWVNPTPAVFAFSSPLLAWSILHFRLTDILPVAYDAVVESIPDGVIVLDAHRHIIAANAAARRTLHRPPGAVSGIPAREVFAGWPVLVLNLIEQASGRGELAIEAGHGRLFFDLRVSSLLDPHGKLTGLVMVFHDITERQQSQTSLHQHAQELDALHSTLLALTTPHELPTLLQDIVVRAVRLIQARGGSLFLADPAKREVQCVVRHRSPPGADRLIHSYGQGAAGIVAETGEPLIIEDHEDRQDRAEAASESSLLAVLSVPMVWQGRVTGVINLYDGQGKQGFTQADLHLLTSFANQAAIAVENARLLQSERRQREQAEILREVTNILNSSLDQEVVLGLILQQLAEVIAYDSASIMLLEEEELTIVASRKLRSPEQLQTPLSIHKLGHVREALERCRPVIIPDVQVDPRWQPSEHSGYIHCWLGAPLFVHGQAIGLLSLDKTETNFYTPADARLAEAFANHAALAIENARLFSAERRRAEELEALRATLADLSSELELSRLLQTIVVRATHLLHATGGDLGLYDENGRGLLVVVSHNMGHDYTGTWLQPGEGAMGYAIQTRQPVIVDDYTHWDKASPQYQNVEGHAVLAVPLLIGSRLVGAIGLIDARHERRFFTSDQHLLTLFAQQAAIAVENARLYQAACEAAERRAVLHKISQEVITANLDPEGFYTTIHQAAAQLMPAEAFTIALLDRDRHEIEAVYLVDRAGRQPSQRFPDNEGLSGFVIRSGQSVYIEDVEMDSHNILWQEIRPVPFGEPDTARSVLSVPLRSGKRVMGAISTQSYHPWAYTIEDQYLLEMLASYAGIALENAELLGEVQRLAQTDPLTEVYNRRHLFDLGQHEFNRAVRFQRPLSVIMLDVDHFKQVNDTAGHAAGDRVLQALAQRLLVCVRDIDIFGRYGGEEFLVILPEAGREEACQVAERLRIQAQEPLPLDRNTDRTISITISLGVAEMSPETKTLTELISAADAAMYTAKQAGRNRVDCG